MKEEFLDYVEDIIKAMDDALSFIKRYGLPNFCER